MSVIHAFPPDVRNALESLRADPADELHTLASKLGGSDAETAKQWRELRKLWHAATLGGYDEFEARHFLEDVRVAEIAAHPDDREKIEEAVRQIRANCCGLL